jgi:hypothetical protein
MPQRILQLENKISRGVRTVLSTFIKDTPGFRRPRYTRCAIGKAHVRYLFNYCDNHLHKLVSPFVSLLTYLPRSQVNDRELDSPSISGDDGGEDRMSDHDPYEDDNSMDFEKDDGSYDGKFDVSDSDWEPESEYKSNSDDY